MKAGHAQQDVEMLDISGAGTQHPMRSHWKLRPGPQSHKNSKQQCKRYRANTVTANSKASAARQTAQQPQPTPLSHRRNSHREGPDASKSRTTGGMSGEDRSAQAVTYPIRPCSAYPRLIKLMWRLWHRAA